MNQSLYWEWSSLQVDLESQRLPNLSEPIPKRSMGTPGTLYRIHGKVGPKTTYKRSYFAPTSKVVPTLIFGQFIGFFSTLLLNITRRGPTLSNKTGWCKPPSPCCDHLSSSFSRRTGHSVLICSWLSTTKRSRILWLEHEHNLDVYIHEPPKK